MSLHALLDALFQWVIAITPFTTVALILIFFVRRRLGLSLHPVIGYTLWLILIVRLCCPWLPVFTVDVSSLMPTEGQAVFPLAEEGRQENFAQRYDSKMNDFEDQRTHSGQYYESNSDLQTPAYDWYDVIFYIWLSGAGTFAIWHAVRYLYWQYRLGRESFRPLPAPLDQYLQESMLKMNIRVNVTASTTLLTSAPAAWGLRKPRIIVPQAMINRLDREQWHCIFIHELIHLRRKDAVWNGLMTGLLILHWFNPLIWRAWHSMREDQELACDAQSMRYVQRRQYGLAMIKVLELIPSHRSTPILSFATGGKQIAKRRIQMIVSKKKPRLSVIAVILLSAISVLAFNLAIYEDDHVQAQRQGIAAEESNKSKTVISGSPLQLIAPSSGTMVTAFGDKIKVNRTEVDTSTGIVYLHTEGSPVYAAADGIITTTDYTTENGKQMAIAHMANYVTTYSHMDEWLVEEGQSVKQGDQIGTMGSTGDTVGVQLSFALTLNGEFINPDRYYFPMRH